MSSKFSNELDLISHLVKGDEQAYVYLAKKFHSPLSNYAFGLTKDDAMAQDIVQEVFLYIWKNRKKLDKVHALKGYLYKITYHQFINQYRKTRAITNLERSYMEALDHAIDDDNAELLKRKIAIVTEAIANLPGRCKETFLLSKKDGLTNIEIAEYMNISVKTVEGQITKAYSILRHEVGSKLKGILFLLFGITSVHLK
jgi:RNA polymerase sigma-70 factor (ECF subfamily)